MRTPAKPPETNQLLQELLSDPADPTRAQKVLARKFDPAPGGRYLHWDKLRHIPPPEGLRSQDWWLGIKLSRRNLYKALPFAAGDHEPIHYAMIDGLLEQLHHLDRRASGAIRAEEGILNPETRDAYLQRSLQEEAIRSSQLEGAATTRKAAKEMLRTRRQPRDRSEQMIYNNYQAMLFIREMKNEKISADGILEIQRIVTEGTLKDPQDAGRLRGVDDSIVVEDPTTGDVLHTPPQAEHLPQLLGDLTAFANGENSEGAFIHPVIRSILLHFMLAYIHPFVDGNGRTARALFYWSMLSRGYWLCEYISISTALKAAPIRYAQSFLHTETDENDATYFIIHQLETIRKAIDNLHAYLTRKAEEIKSAREVIRAATPLADRLNHRQVTLLNHAIGHPGFTYTINSHRTSHGVSYQTARTDLLELAELGLLAQGKIGKKLVFEAPANLRQILDRYSRDEQDEPV